MSANTGLPGSRRTTITVGTFDGMHRGHQAVLAEIVRRARAAGRASVLVTFEPHPLEIVAPHRAPRLLTTLLERKILWPAFDLDYVLVLPFTETMRRMSPEAFVTDVLVRRLRVGELVIGHDHGFGRDRKGDVETLRRLGRAHGFDLDVVGPVNEGSDAISSTRIRRAVGRGDFAAASAGLGRPYSAYARVVRGAGRGASIGFATANLDVDTGVKCLPPEGVYAVTADVDGRWVPAMANLGARPTYGEEGTRLEVHLIDWDGPPLYGSLVGVAFVQRLRGVRRFDGPDDLAEQLHEDRGTAREVLGDRVGLA